MKRAAAIYAMGVLGLAYLCMSSSARAADCALQSGPTRAVTQVIDSETLRLDDNSEVRLAGILAPRPPDSAADTIYWPPAQEARDALVKLVGGQSIEIAHAGPRNDRYGRTLAQVFVLRDGRRIWVQGEMLASGHVRAHSLGGATDCAAELIGHERVAFEERRGLWSNAAYQVRAASQTQELMRYRHTLQLIEGEVMDVAEVKGRIYLNFGSEWRTDFTAGVEKGRGAGWPTDMKSLKGERVRVRGFIERRNGPYVELADPNHLEILPAEATAAIEPERRSRRARRKSPAEPTSPAK